MISPERRKFAEDAVSRGAFMYMRLNLWRGIVSRRIKCEPGGAPLPRALGKFEGRLAFSRAYNIPWLRRKQTWFAVRLLIVFKDCAYRTRFGWFVPDCGLEPIYKALAQAKNDLEELNKTVVSGYDRLRGDVMAAHARVIPEIWTKGFGYSGEPTQNFRDEEIRRYMAEFPSVETILSRNWLKSYPYSPLIDGSMPCAKHFDPAGHNTAVFRAVFDAVLARRQRLAALASVAAEQLQIRPPVTVRQRLFRKLMGFKRGKFWEEPELDSMVSRVQDMAMTRDKDPSVETEVAALRELVKYLLDHPFFRMAADVGPRTGTGNGNDF